MLFSFQIGFMSSSGVPSPLKDEVELCVCKKKNEKWWCSSTREDRMDVNITRNKWVKREICEEKPNKSEAVDHWKDSKNQTDGANNNTKFWSRLNGQPSVCPCSTRRVCDYVLTKLFCRWPCRCSANTLLSVWRPPGVQPHAGLISHDPDTVINEAHKVAAQGPRPPRGAPPQLLPKPSES